MYQLLISGEIRQCCKLFINIYFVNHSNLSFLYLWHNFFILYLTDISFIDKFQIVGFQALQNHSKASFVQLQYMDV